MQILIAYATKLGQTAKIARHIAAVLTEQGHAPELFNLDETTRRPDPTRFGAAILAAPIHVGGYPSSIVSFARKHRTTLNAMPSAFVSVGLAIASKTTDGRAQTSSIVDKLLHRTGWRPVRTELVAGALPYTKYGVLTRFVMRRISAHEGGDTDTTRDYEYTDWAALEGAFKEFASGLPAPQRGRQSAVRAGTQTERNARA